MKVLGYREGDVCALLAPKTGSLNKYAHLTYHTTRAEPIPVLHILWLNGWVQTHEVKGTWAAIAIDQSPTRGYCST
jgi:hypothetical protein